MGRGARATVSEELWQMGDAWRQTGCEGNKAFAVARDVGKKAPDRCTRCALSAPGDENDKPGRQGTLAVSKKDFSMTLTIKHGLRIGVAGSALTMALALAPATALAQEGGITTQEATEDTPDLDTLDDRGTIIVTGTRISNPNLEQASPVAVVSREEYELQGAVVVEDVLREVPGIVPNVGGNVNNGNGGSTFLDLRGIGNQRNLTLLNGTRLVPATFDGPTNVDVIPIAMIERTDVLTGGAGATYGADAISGVVNFITRDNFEGAEISATNQITEQGDGLTQRIDLTVGGNFEDGRGNATLSVGFTNREAVFQGDREFGINNISSFSGAPGGSSTAVPSVIVIPGTNSGTLQVSPDGGSLIPFYSPFNFNPFNLYQLPLEQYRIFATGRFEVSDGLELFSEALFVQSTTETIVAPTGTFRNVIDTPLSNPFLPTTIRNQICGFDSVTDDEDDPATIGIQPLFSQAECDAAALATDPSDPAYREIGIDYGRRFVEFGNRFTEYKTQLFQIKVGARGEVFQNFNWELFGAYGESENQNRVTGYGSLSRLEQAVRATDPNECIDPSNGCVPIDLFGPLGSITQANQDFIDVATTGAVNTTLGQVQGFVSGDLFTLFGADPVAAAAGFEYREYSASSTSDLLSQTPGEVLGAGAANPDFFGGYDVYEFFGELLIPVLSDLPFAQELTLDLGARFSEYSTTGGEFTWKAGGTYTPVDGFQVRGGYQRVTRAPNIGELFQPQTTGLDNFDEDPCAGAAPVNNAALRATCLAQGAPTSSIGSIIVDPAGQVNVTFGGNPDLDAENAYTWTVGAVLQPDFLPGFTATVDYYNIVVRDAITEPNIGDVFAACFGPPPFAGSGDPGDAACTSIRRNPATGNLFGSVATTPGLPLLSTNQGRIFTDGIDLVLNYTRQMGLFGVDLNFAGNWTNNHKFKANQDAEGDSRDCVGFYSINCSLSGSIIPEFSFNQRTTVSFDPFALSLNWRFIDGVEYEPVANSFLEEFTTIPSEHYFDLSLRARVMDNASFIFTVANLTDNKPKVVGSNIGSTAFNSGNIYPSTYDPLGRRYAVTVNLGF